MAEYYWWIGPVVLVGLRLFLYEARLTRIRASGHHLVFRSGLGGRILVGVTVVGFMYLIVTSLGTEENWVVAGALVMVCLMCLAWPSTIILTSSGIREERWWRFTVSLPWTEVTAVEKAASGDMLVYGRNGQRVVFTRFHVDPYRFRHEVLTRAKLGHISDAQTPPTLRL